MLRNKIVKVRDFHILQFFYPEYVVREQLSFLTREENVIYVGKSMPRIREKLEENTKSFISIIGPYDVDLTSPYKLIEFVYSKYGKTPSSAVLETVSNLDIEDVERMCKEYWVLGRWVEFSEESEYSMFDLFKASTESLTKTLFIYFKLREVYPLEVIDTSFVTFLVRVHSYEEQSVSPYYMQVLIKAHNKYGSRIRSAMEKWMYAGDSELSFIDLLTDLR